jgi:hypothetical protein
MIKNRKQNIRTFALLLLGAMLSQWSVAQKLTGAQVKFADNFTEWNIYYLADSSSEQEDVGELRATFANAQSLDDWDYRLGEQSGRIHNKWRNDPNGEWEIRADNRLVTANRIYSGDPRFWRVRAGKTDLEFSCKYNNLANEWIVQSERNGTFFVYATHEGDWRDWTITDDTVDLSLPVRMMLLFVVLQSNLPHR